MTPTKGNITHENHYRPQSWLKLWCGPNGKLWSYRRLENRNVVGPREVSPRATGKETDLYTLVPESETHELGVSPDHIEKTFFQPIDDVAQVLRLIVDSGLSALTADQKKAAARFIIALYGRSYSVVTASKERAAAIFVEEFARPPPTIGIDPRRLPGAATDPVAVANNLALGAMKSGINDPAAMKWALAATWHLIRYPNDSLLTSDEPLLFGSDPKTDAISHLSFALDPRTMLILSSNPAAVPEDQYRDIAVFYVMQMLRCRTARSIYMRKNPDTNWMPGLQDAVARIFGPMQQQRDSRG